MENEKWIMIVPQYFCRCAYWASGTLYIVHLDLIRSKSNHSRLGHRRKTYPRSHTNKHEEKQANSCHFRVILWTVFLSACTTLWCFDLVGSKILITSLDDHGERLLFSPGQPVTVE